MKQGKFYGVGLGPGDPGLVTLKAAEVLRNVTVIYTVASRQSSRSISAEIIDSLPGISARKVGLEFTMARDFGERLARIEEHAKRILNDLNAGNDCAFTTIGDPMTYSTCGYLLRILRRLEPELAFEIIPGVNSWSALAAASAEPLVEDNEILRIVPGYLAPDSAVLESVMKPEGTVVFLKTYRERDRYADLLRERGCRMVYGANIGLANEFFSKDPEEISSRPEEYLSMLLGKTKS